MNRLAKKRTISSRKDQYTAVTLLTMIGALIFRIPLGYMIGDKGIACFAVANEIYLVIAGTVSYGLSESVAALVKYRVKREQHKNARKVLNGALLFGGVLGLIFSGFFCFFAFWVAEKIMHMPLSGLSIGMMAPAMFFMIITGVFKGYFQGNGTRMPALHSQILHLIVMFAGGLIGAGLVHEYGMKISALLQSEDHASAYGAMGASIGIFSASVLCFLHMLALYFIYRGSMRKQSGRDQIKNQNSGFQIVSMLAGTGLIYSLVWICFKGLPLIDQYMFFLLGDRSGESVSMWGAYYGKCLVLPEIISGIIIIISLKLIRQVAGSVDRDEARTAQEKLGILIHQSAVLTIPSAVFLAVFSGNLMGLFFSESNKQIISWLQLGSVLIVLSVYAAVFMEILIKSRKIKYVVLTGAGALALHIGFLFLLLKTAKLGITGVIIANLFFYILVAGAGFWFMIRSFQYTQEWIKCFAVTVIASAIAGIIAMLLNKVFIPILGEAVSMIICLLVSIIIYMVLLIVTRAFREGELEEMTGGRILIMLAGLLHIS